MYDDMDERTLAREAWEDDIEAFIPSFATVKVTQIANMQYAATMVIDRDGDLAIRLMDEDETSAMEFKMTELLNFDPRQCVQAPWEQFIGLLEVSSRFGEFSELLFAKVDQVRDLMDEQGLPHTAKEARQHLRVIRGAKQDQ